MSPFDSKNHADSSLPQGLITSRIAKNYLNAPEIRQLNRIITMYLDYAEMQAGRKQPVYMKDWKEKLDAFLRFNEQEILSDKGTVSMEVAKQLALVEYEKFSAHRRAEENAVADSEFDQMVKRLPKKP